MRSIRLWLWCGLLCCIQFISGCSGEFRLRQCLDRFDEQSGQKPVETYAKARALIDGFKKVRYSQLKQSYVSYEKLDQMSKKYHSKWFYVVPGDAQFRFIVGRQRIMDVLPTNGDAIYEQVVKSACKTDKRII